MFTIDGYRYNGKIFNKVETATGLANNLPTVENVIVVPYLKQNEDIDAIPNSSFWDDVLTTSGELIFDKVPFNHLLWILYSSGTTCLPKSIVQGHGGILLAQFALHGIQGNLTPTDVFFWQTTTGWMMWNTVVGAMLTGSSIVLYDGNPSYPDLGVLWRLAEKSNMTSFGTSPASTSTTSKRIIVVL